MKKELPSDNLSKELETLINSASRDSVTFEAILEVLPRRGHAVLLILLSLPFCQPIQIPGFSFFFGALLAFIGLRIAFGHRAWVPNALLKREISTQTLKKIASVALKIVDKMSFLTRPRMNWLVVSPSLFIMHGMVITLLAILLALPLPIPLTNLITAFPILFFGLGMLEDDGLMVIIAYVLSLICFALFASLIWFGKEGVEAFFNFF